MIICATGHRPQKLPGGFSPSTFNLLVKTAGEWLDANPRVSEVISGMALGWDQAIAQAALDRMIPVHAFIPFPGQADGWPMESHVRYQKLLRQCASHRTISRGPYHPGMMQIRNEAMVDASGLVVALWDGSSGGTGNCVKYAESCMKEIVNLWEDAFGM